MKKLKNRYFNRDLSWLSFNYRVLQEANNREVPLIERLKFLAIYSSNLDEFYRVRVALHRNILVLKIKTKENGEVNRKKLLTKIKKKVGRQLNEFGEIYRNVLLPELAQNNIRIVNEENVTEEQLGFIHRYFKSKILPELKLVFYGGKNDQPFLENKQIYFALKLNLVKPKNKHKAEFAILNIPSDKLPRFISLPSKENHHEVIFLDDILRMCLHFLFRDHEVKACYSIKISRDAELFLEDSDNLVDEIKKKLVKRKTNPPSRFLYDAAMPKDLLKHLKRTFLPVKDFLIPGGKYHNYEDFFTFPSPVNPKLKYPVLEELNHRGLHNKKSFFSVITKCDQILHFPYQDYKYVVDFLERAATDPQVRTIKITLYRVADDSKIANALLKAAANGKEVFAFVEIKARFNEISNIYWSQQFIDAGIKVFYSFKKLKVHAKLCMVEREEGGKLKRYAYLSTGNFNEKTAKIYCDHGFFTAKKELTSEANKIFDYFHNTSRKPKFKSFLVAPFNMRAKLEALIDNEINNAKAGKKASMILKMNSLEDHKMIDRLYKAGKAGVKITIIVRGICCLVPGVKGLSDKIKVISIVDRFLEHGRVFIFHNDGNEQIYISSADLMSRNLNNRIESAFPIVEDYIKKEIKHLISLQLKDNTKARKLNKTQSNPYKKTASRKKVRAQLDTHKYLKQLTENI
ncbi:MAG TPA: polyphosphate kinase 1 [Bacteroidia bacterium]|nr:polyphosphate kinase 1 [Bacteroidia bacterium]